MLDITKVQEFVTLLETKGDAFLTTLDTLLQKAEANGPIKDFLTTHFPQALTWAAELDAAVVFAKSAELKALPEIAQVLAFLASIFATKAA